MQIKRKIILTSGAMGTFLLLVTCIPNLINIAELDIISSSGGGALSIGGNNNAVDLPVNTNYAFSAQVDFKSGATIEVLNLSIEATNAYFYLGYNTNVGGYLSNGLKISSRLENASNTNFTLTLANPLSCLSYTHLAVIEDVESPVIISYLKYSNTNECSDAVDLPANPVYKFSAELFFESPSNIEVLNFSIEAANAFFYLGYSTTNAGDYLSNGLRISDKLENASNTNFRLTLTNALSSFPYTHVAVIDDIDTPVIISEYRYTNTDYNFSGEAFFENDTNIVVSNFGILAANAFFYLGYGGDEADDYLANGLKISEKLESVSNTNFILSLSNPLSSLPYSHLAVIDEIDPPVVVNDWRYNFSGEAFFENDTSITFSNFSLLAANAFFYLGDGSDDANDYLDNGLKISDKLENTGLTNFIFPLANPLSLDHTHLAVINDIEPPSILEDWRYRTPSQSPYIGQTVTMPDAPYGTSGTTVTFVSERQIDVDLNFTSAPGAFIYLGFGGSASDYINNGIRISQRLTGSANLTLTLDEDLADLPYTHVAIICVPFSIIINPGVQYK